MLCNTGHTLGIARRGQIKQIHSDNGTNFVVANALLQEIHRTSEWAKNNLKIDWKFQPPLSPHHGGLHEAAVKSAKNHIKRTVGTNNLTIEEWFTLIAQVEACVNSRPLQPITDDPSDTTALTPGHFLIGEELITLVEPRPLRKNSTTLSSNLAAMAQEIPLRTNKKKQMDIQTTKHKTG